MKAVLLCAGFARRLGSLTKDFPKPLLPVGGVPILADVIEQLGATRLVDEWIIVSNARFASRFNDFADDARRAAPGIELRVIDNGVEGERQQLGAVADLRFAIERCGIDSPILVAAGDNLFRFNLGKLGDAWRRRPRTLVTMVREPDLEKLRRTGVAEVDGDRLVRLWEKPRDPPTRWACPPLYVLEPDAWRCIPDLRAAKPDADAPGELIAWIAQKVPVFTCELEGRRLDIGNRESYDAAEAWLREDTRSPEAR